MIFDNYAKNGSDVLLWKTEKTGEMRKNGIKRKKRKRDKNRENG